MKRVLVVDDDIVMLRLVQLQVKRAQCEGDYFRDVESALKALPNLKPDLVILDYSMPGLTGVDFFKALRSNALTAMVPVVFVTGAVDTATLREIQSLGPIEVLSKPFSPRRLQTLIEEMMQS
jgi:CheY-like chemotaxis protein